MGKLGLVLMGRAMFSKSLIRFSVDVDYKSFYMCAFS